MKDLIVVEGMGDQNFVEGLLAAIGKNFVKPFPPKQLGGPSNGISNVLKVIPVLMNQILAGTTERAAILVDADFAGVNGGFTLRRQEITSALASQGYTIPPTPPANSPKGEVFSHPDGRTPIGLFILPDHHGDGMLEDLLKDSITSAPFTGTLEHAINVVSGINPKLFNENIHLSKAQIGTFLAWQNKPPASVKACISADIFNPHSPAMSDVIQWLHRVFP